MKLQQEDFYTNNIMQRVQYFNDKFDDVTAPGNGNLGNVVSR
jgi:hypothetical protein